MSDEWGRIEPLLRAVERPTRYVDHEWGATSVRDAQYRVALAYPDAYEVGMANQALQVLREQLRVLDGVAVERVFVPWGDHADALRRERVPLTTLESSTPLADCDLIGITLPYELTYTNILELLDLGRVPLRAAARGEDDPIVIGGGPCAFNCEPVGAFFDAIVLGDGEEAIQEIVAVHRGVRSAGGSRADLLEALAAMTGVYVPTLQSPDSAPRPTLIRKRLLLDLDAVASPTCPIVPYMDVVHDRATVEVLRGCARGCRFCQAGMIYRPVRERSADRIVSDTLETLGRTGYEEVSLTSLSTADHSMLSDVLRRLSKRLEGRGVSISVPSLRVDAFSLSIARLLSGGRKTGLTFAPEAGTQRLRDVINKNVTEEELLATVTKAFEAGWRRVKLYFMIGLPTETDEDVVAIGDLVQRVLAAVRGVTPPAERGSVRVSVSVATFVPKAHTPFQWEGQLPLDEVRRRQGVLRGAMPHKGVELSWHDADVSFLEGVFARGGPELAAVVEEAWRRGAVFCAWTEHFSLEPWRAAFEACGVDAERIACAPREPGEPLPWSHLDSGVTERFLLSERMRAAEGATTPDCTFEDCSSCGVCSSYGASNIIGSERHA